VNLDELAAQTKGYVGADIEAVCREAGMVALRENPKSKEIKTSNFDEALSIVRPSVTKEIEKTYENLKDQFRTARAREMKEKPIYLG